MNSSKSLNEILDKLQYLVTATIFFKSKDALKEEFLNINMKVSQISDGINELRTKLNKMRDENNQCWELLLLMQSLDNKIIHMERNVPPQLIHNFHDRENELSSALREILSINGQEAAENDIKTSVKDCKKVLFMERNVYPTIPLITQNEFNNIPKYIIGRQSLVAVNSLVDCINQILKTKYTFLSLGKAHARKQDNLSRYLHYKKQDLDICTAYEYVYFFTDEDYELYTKTKLNRTKLNLLTVLRHCKRLKEHKTKSDRRYVVIEECNT